MARILRAASCALVLLVSGCSVPDVKSLQGDPLNPEAFRPQLVLIDQVVFDAGDVEDVSRDQVAQALLVLATAAEADRANTIARALAPELRTLSARVTGTRGGTSYAASRLPEQWLRIRGRLFSDAAWFRRSSADPVAPAVAGPPPPSALRPATTEERRGLDSTLTSLVLLIKTARLDLPNANDSGERRGFSDEAARELVVDVERLGPTPDVFGVDNFYRAAHIAATAAIGDLQMLASLRSAQTSGRETLIGNAEKHLAKAQAAAAKMSKQ